MPHINSDWLWPYLQNNITSYLFPLLTYFLVLFYSLLFFCFFNQHPRILIPTSNTKVSQYPQCSCTYVELVVLQGGSCVVSLSLFLHRFDAARLVLSSPPCRKSWLLHFLYAPKKSTFSGPVFMVGRSIRGRNPSKTFGTMREQCIAATECLRMDWKIKRWLHKCYAWQRSRTTVYGHH